MTSDLGPATLPCLVTASHWMKLGQPNFHKGDCRNPGSLGCKKGAMIDDDGSDGDV